MVWNCVNKSWSGKRKRFCQSSLSQICVSDCVDFMWVVVGVGVLVGRYGGRIRFCRGGLSRNCVSECVGSVGCCGGWSRFRHGGLKQNCMC